MTGYERKELTLSHRGDAPVTLAVEVDVTGDGAWALYREFSIEPGRSLRHAFPDAFGAYWVRVTASADTEATAQLQYS